jgi:hypothetical protein
MDRAHHKYPPMQPEGLSCQRLVTMGQRSEVVTERHVDSIEVRHLDDAVALRAPSERRNTCGRAIDHAVVSLDDTPLLLALDHRGAQDDAQLVDAQWSGRGSRALRIAQSIVPRQVPPGI